MDRQTDRPMDRQIDRQIDRQVQQIIDRQMDRQIDRQLDRWINGQTDQKRFCRFTDGWMAGQIDRSADFCRFFCVTCMCIFTMCIIYVMMLHAHIHAQIRILPFFCGFGLKPSFHLWWHTLDYNRVPGLRITAIPVYIHACTVYIYSIFGFHMFVPTQTCIIHTFMHICGHICICIYAVYA